MQITIFMKIVYEAGFFIDVKILFSAPLTLQVPQRSTKITIQVIYYFS